MDDNKKLKKTDRIKHTLEKLVNFEKPSPLGWDGPSDNPESSDNPHSSIDWHNKKR